MSVMVYEVCLLSLQHRDMMKYCGTVHKNGECKYMATLVFQ